MLISFNGVDGTGKTTQIDWLQESFEINFVPRIRNFDSRWGSIDSQGRVIGDVNYWMSKENLDDFIDINLHSLANLSQYLETIKDKNGIFVQDRGINCWLASLTSIVRFKTGYTHEKAEEYLERYKQDHDIVIKPVAEDLTILLYQDKSVDGSVNKTMQKKFSSADEANLPIGFLSLYRQYQYYFNEALSRQRKKQIYNLELFTDNNIISVQNEIRKKINSINSTITLPLILPGLQEVYFSSENPDIAMEGISGIDQEKEFRKKIFLLNDEGRLTLSIKKGTILHVIDSALGDFLEKSNANFLTCQDAFDLISGRNKNGR